MCADDKNQGHNKVVEIDSWEIYEDNEVYPEGSKDKSLHIAPKNPVYKFIIPEHKYLFKLSYDRYPEQFWVEIIAYKLGELMGIQVPPTFVATNKRGSKTGALVEWFYGYPGTGTEMKIAGTAYMQMFIDDYDKDKGRQHNFGHIEALHRILGRKTSFILDWKKYWTEVLTFDALIGNTDRHQDNWGVIWVPRDKKFVPIRMTPIFDNGTSMGHEILEEKFANFDAPSKIAKYIAKGTHHMKWRFEDTKRLNHVEFLKIFIMKFPEAKQTIINLLDFDTEKLKCDIIRLTKIDVPCKLSQARADFII